MHLWTDYEGNILSGYTVGRLTRSEGRSAFFLTVDEQDKPALLRLTETHFDEGELIGRWRGVAAVTHPNLQGIANSGKATFQGTALACCLLEPIDGSLSDVLRERTLSTDEALEVAEAVAAALAALHSAGLVHEHVDSTNVFAVGETIKLRSDCVRECAGDFEADTDQARAALRARDVHDLGLLIRRCLTPQWQESADTTLPAPLDRIVRRALGGTVTANEIVAELEARKPLPPLPLPQRVPAATAPAPNASGNAPAPGRAPASPSQLPHVTPSSVKVAAGAASAAASRPRNTASPAPAATPIYAGLPTPYVDEAGAGARSSAAAFDSPSSPSRRPQHVAHKRSAHDPAVDQSQSDALSHLAPPPRPSPSSTSASLRPAAVPAFLRSRSAMVAAAAAVVLAFGGWATFHHRAQPAAEIVQGAPATQPAHPASTAVAPVALHSRTAAPASTAPVARQSSLIRSGEQAGWRVIAYTYNYEKQAAAKAEQLQRRYMALQPQVFSPSGHAPYFVALGGPSDADSAIALRNRARHSGLPRDTFARNF